jgi:hypothetical protein
LEKEKAEILAEIEKNKEQTNKYNDKLGKLKFIRDKYTSYIFYINLLIIFLKKMIFLKNQKFLRFGKYKEFNS